MRQSIFFDSIEKYNINVKIQMGSQKGKDIRTYISKGVSLSTRNIANSKLDLNPEHFTGVTTKKTITSQPNEEMSE